MNKDRRCRIRFRVPVLLLAAGLALTAGAAAGPAREDSGFSGIGDDEIADESRGDWLAYGRTHSERRFSPLHEIDVDNVGQLAPAWYLDLPADSGLVSTPLVANGVLYFVGSLNVVRAVDAATGELLWEHDPKLLEHVGNHRRLGWMHNRGLTLWNDKIYQATWDGRLIALDANSGIPVWTQRTFDESSRLYITGAPKAFKGKILIGNGGTEIGPTRGYVSAYDAETGDLAWRFWIVPGNPADGFENPAMEMAAKTWTGEWWKVGGGGNAWHGMTYDAELDQLYIGTGNGSPWNRKIRSPGGGDNLFLCSLVALDPDTGEYLWHYQTTPGETWDFNSNMDIVLADLELGGETVKAILHAPKNGFFYVIDRRSGELVSAEPFAETTWASRIDPETGRPVEVPGARYEDAEARVAPSPWGAHSWHAMSYNPMTGLAYVPTIDYAGFFDDRDIDLETWESPDGRIDFGTRWRPDTPDSHDEQGSLLAWDPVRQKPAWRVTMPGAWNPGTLTTAGNLVFQGRMSGELLAYAADTGRELWRTDLGLGVSAPPITYAIDGRQYVALLVGFGGGGAGMADGYTASLGWSYGAQTRRLVAFALEGKAKLPAQPKPAPVEPLRADGFRVDAALAANGGTDYEGICASCHGFGGMAGGMAPDLRASPAVVDAAAFKGVVHEGTRRARGMPIYANLSDDQLLAIRHYIRQQAELAIPD